MQRTEQEIILSKSIRKTHAQIIYELDNMSPMTMSAYKSYLENTAKVIKGAGKKQQYTMVQLFYVIDAIAEHRQMDDTMRDTIAVWMAETGYDYIVSPTLAPRSGASSLLQEMVIEPHDGPKFTVKYFSNEVCPFDITVSHTNKKSATDMRNHRGLYMFAIVEGIRRYIIYKQGNALD